MKKREFQISGSHYYRRYIILAYLFFEKRDVQNIGVSLLPQVHNTCLSFSEKRDVQIPGSHYYRRYIILANAKYGKVVVDFVSVLIAPNII
jgi:hypothetical protein